jgi:hypothetical protein
MGGAIVVALSINADRTQACGVNERNNMPSDISNSVSAIMTPPEAARYLGTRGLDTRQNALLGRQSVFLGSARPRNIR